MGMGIRSVCRPGVVGSGCPELPGHLDDHNLRSKIFDRMEELPENTAAAKRRKECSPGRKPWVKSRQRVSPVRDGSNEVDIRWMLSPLWGSWCFLQLIQDLRPFDFAQGRL